MILENIKNGKFYIRLFGDLNGGFVDNYLEDSDMKKLQRSKRSIIRNSIRSVWNPRRPLDENRDSTITLVECSETGQRFHNAETIQVKQSELDSDFEQVIL